MNYYEILRYIRYIRDLTYTSKLNVVKYVKPDRDIVHICRKLIFKYIICIRLINTNHHF